MKKKNLATSSENFHFDPLRRKISMSPPLCFMIYYQISIIWNQKKMEKKKKSRNLLRKFSNIFEFWLLNFFQPGGILIWSKKTIPIEKKMKIQSEMPKRLETSCMHGLIFIIFYIVHLGIKSSRLRIFILSKKTITIKKKLKIQLETNILTDFGIFDPLRGKISMSPPLCFIIYYQLAIICHQKKNKKKISQPHQKIFAIF